MLEKLLRARLPEQIVALIEHIEQNPDTSHLIKLERFLGHTENELTKFERWMLRQIHHKISNVIRRDETLRRAISIVINVPEEKYDSHTYARGLYDTEFDRMLKEKIAKQHLSGGVTSTWIDPRLVQARDHRIVHDNY